MNQHPNRPTSGLRTTALVLVAGLAAAVLAAPVLFAAPPQPPKEKKPVSSPQPQQRKVGYSDTPFLPGNKWRVHDGTRPQPTIITPGTFSTQDAPGRPPSDAVVLFGGTDLSQWKSANGDGPAPWKTENGVMITGGGNIVTKGEWGDCQLHVEFCAPNPPHGQDQGRGNSGVFLMGRYEMQVLDNYDNITYADGQAGSVYGQYPPFVNASRKPGEWQVYDILWTAPRFGVDGKVTTPAYVTILHNGVVVQNHSELFGATGHRNFPGYTAHGPTGPIALQDHGDPVRYRNLWIRPLKDHDQP